MDLDNIGSFVSTVGFPIAVCLMLLYFIYKHIIPYIQEATKSNKECTETLILMNERMSNAERDISVIKDDVKDIKNKIHLCHDN